MNTSDKNGDKELKKYLSGGSGVSRAYQRHATEEPSVAADEAIRAAAKREVRTGPGHIVNPFGRHWTVPASLAAVLLLSVGLVIFMSDETGETRFGSDVLEEKLIGRDPGQPAARQDRFTEDKAVTPAVSAPSTSGAAARRPEKKAKQAKTSAPVSTSDVRKTQRRGEPARVPVEPTLQKKVPAMKPDAVRPGLQREMESPAAATDSDILPPELWLAQIRDLRAQGKINEAKASLMEFRKVYPDYPHDNLHK